MQDPKFREEEYLAKNPDVADAVRRGDFSSGWEHFATYGRFEGRGACGAGRMADAHPGRLGVNSDRLRLALDRLSLACTLIRREWMRLRRNPLGLPAEVVKLSRYLAPRHWGTVRQRMKEELAWPERSYKAWVSAFDTLSPAQIAEWRTMVPALPRQPLVSVLVPVFNTPEPLLRECLNSVLAQAYPHWELCVADDASTAPRVRQVLEEYAGRDARVRVVFRETNGHISAASNSALAIARGEFVALLDHDDLLRPHALAAMMVEFNRREFDLAYSDEDKLDSAGIRFQPFFKPDWNEEFFLANNYLCHLTLLRRDVVNAVGGFRVGFEGAQDFDLLLRVSRSIPPARIAHIPQILYHWRAVGGSTALHHGEKDYASEAGLRAVREHLAARAAPASAEPGPLPTTYRVRWRVPADVPLVSIIIPTRDRVGLLRQCLTSIFERSSYRSYEIVIADNDSCEFETLTYLAELESSGRARILRYPGPFNFAAINNQAVGVARGCLLAFVNNDVEVVSPDWLDEMVGYAVRPEIGAVGCKLLYPNNTIQHAGLILGVYGVAGHSFKGMPAGSPGANGRIALPQALSAVTGACMVVRRQVFQEVGGFDQKQFKVAFNDVDLCIRIRDAGYRNVYTPFAVLYHHESASRGNDMHPKRIARFRAELEAMLSRWGNVLRTDPAYNPNLTLEADNFSLAWPPRQGASPG